MNLKGHTRHRHTQHGHAGYAGYATYENQREQGMTQAHTHDTSPHAWHKPTRPIKTGQEIEQKGRGTMRQRSNRSWRVETRGKAHTRDKSTGRGGDRTRGDNTGQDKIREGHSAYVMHCLCIAVWMLVLLLFCLACLVFMSCWCPHTFPFFYSLPHLRWCKPHI